MGLRTSRIVEDVYVNNYIDNIRDAINEVNPDDPQIATYVHPEVLPDLIKQMGPGGGFKIIVLVAGQYDPSTRVPTISDPTNKAIYLVPKVDSNAIGADDYIEWIYLNGVWEQLGNNAVALSNSEIDQACTPLII